MFLLHLCIDMFHIICFQNIEKIVVVQDHFMKGSLSFTALLELLKITHVIRSPQIRNLLGFHVHQTHHSKQCGYLGGIRLQILHSKSKIRKKNVTNKNSNH